jgi:hypothetical protein
VIAMYACPIDVALAAENGKRLALAASLVVECKFGKRPWVVLSSTSAQYPAAWSALSTVATDLGEALLYCAAYDTALAGLALFQYKDLVGQWAIEAAIGKEGNPKDTAYQGLMQVCSATRGLRDRSNETISVKDGLPVFAHLFFPVIVLEGDLFVAHQPEGPAATMSVTQVEQARLRWSGLDAAGAMNVDIVTKQALPEYAKSRRSELAKLADVLVEQWYRKLVEARAKNSYAALGLTEDNWRGSMPRVLSKLRQDEAKKIPQR